MSSQKTRNEIHLTGRLGKDPEGRYFDNGGMIVNVSLATNYGYKKKDGDWHNETDWHNVVVKGKSADQALNYKKGDMVSLTGMLRYRSWQKEGKTHTIAEVHTQALNAAGERQQQAPPIKEGPEGKDSLPF
jgi:single-strand DNA-binding protein